MTIRFTLFPSWIRSKKDGQSHYITEEMLCHLYQVTPNEYRVHRILDREPDIDTYWLRPLYRGDYLESKQFLIDNGMTRRKQCEAEGAEDGFLGGKKCWYSIRNEPNQHASWLKGCEDERARRKPKEQQ